MIWIKENLFKTTKDSIVTVIAALILGYILYLSIKYVFFIADWEIDIVNLRLLMIGRYPATEEIRLVLFLIALSTCIGLIAGYLEGKSIQAKTYKSLGFARSFFNYLNRFWIISAVLILLLTWAGTFGPVLVVLANILALSISKTLGRLAVKTKPDLSLFWILTFSVILCALFAFYAFKPLDKVDELGGFFLNCLIALASVVACIPLGIILALGRLSKMRIVSILSTLYIELIRGAPLFVLLLLSGTLVEFFLPGTFDPPNILRSFIVFTLFTGAYMAEIVRGGLQSLPNGQKEAAQALGLSTYKQTTLIILPQALRNVIPAQIGQLISLFKDTTLAGVALSLFEVLAVARAIPIQDAFRNEFRLFETLLFTALLFWSVAYTVSKESQRFERKLGVAQ